MSINLTVPVYTAIRYMVCDIDGPVRGFPTKIQAEAFIGFRPEMWITYVPRITKTYQVEEAPF